MMHYLRLVGLFIRISIQNDTAYRANILFNLVMALITLGAELIGLWTIFANARSLGGWTVFQMLALIGIFRFMVGIIGLCISPNMRMIMEDIRDGKLDFVLLKPVDAQFFASARRIVIWRVTDLIVGLAMVVVGCAHLSTSISMATILSTLAMLAAGTVIIYSFWLVLATCAIWFTRLSNIEMVFWNLFEAGRYPVDVYPYWLRIGLTYVIPLAFLTTFPAGALLGKTHLPGIGLAALLAVISLVLSSLFWRFGLRCYSGASA